MVDSFILRTFLLGNENFTLQGPSLLDIRTAARRLISLFLPAVVDSVIVQSEAEIPVRSLNKQLQILTHTENTKNKE